MDSEKEKRASYENASLPMEKLQRKGHRNTMPPPVWTWSTRPSNGYAVRHYGSVYVYLLGYYGWAAGQQDGKRQGIGILFGFEMLMLAVARR